MIELICHLIGDYALQNHWMATTKTRSWFSAVVHAACYTVPFLILTQNSVALAVICGTHAVIDRYRLASYWINFYGVGVEGKVLAFIRRRQGYVLGEVEVKPDTIETRWVRKSAVVYTFVNPYGLDAAARNDLLLATSLPRIADAPPFLGVWLLIIVDNTMHLTINHLVLAWSQS